MGFFSSADTSLGQDAWSLGAKAYNTITEFAGPILKAILDKVGPAVPSVAEIQDGISPGEAVRLASFIGLMGFAYHYGSTRVRTWIKTTDQSIEHTHKGNYSYRNIEHTHQGTVVLRPIVFSLNQQEGNEFKHTVVQEGNENKGFKLK